MARTETASGKQVNAGDLNVRYTERGEGPPVVLVHGGLATAEIMWNQGTIAPVVAKYRVIFGDRDRGSLDDAVMLSRTLGNAELAVVPNSEHGAATKPLFWTNVLDFLERHR